MTNHTEPIYVVREQSISDDPSEQGPELKRFRDYEEAKEYSDNLWFDDGIRSYVSAEYQINE